MTKPFFYIWYTDLSNPKSEKSYKEEEIYIATDFKSTMGTMVNTTKHQSMLKIDTKAKNK